ncbi:uncharacterized protein LOC132555295 [Ylistrum balloti]|uniref:uncharacterized protein LOC132555295 n=1 Tax=Ylistrum balloti TaxID=509963 RepID=UPI002905EA49|nr:uncharacterized protein LOC132555295 [Ylistrum balloti]
MDSLVPNFCQVGQFGLGRASGHNHVGQHGQSPGQVTYEELDRPAKELALDVLYQLSLKLQNVTRGNWASLAEIMGYSRDKIDEFEHQSTAEYKPPGYLVLRDWTKQERGRSIYVLLETLKECGRLDCVTFLEQKIKNLVSMKLHLKIIDETISSDMAKPYFLTVPTRCQATLKESLENVFGGKLQDYEILASWTDRAHQFKGMHLSVRRKRRSRRVVSPTAYLESPQYHNQGQQNNLSDPNEDVSGNQHITCQDNTIKSGERNIPRVSSRDQREDSTIVQNVQSFSVNQKRCCPENCPGHKGYVSEECMYCGKFKTFSQKIVHSVSHKEADNGAVRIIESGFHCRSCTCDLSVIGGVACSSIERPPMKSNMPDMACDIARTESEIVKRKLIDDSENVVSSTTDMDVNKKVINSEADTNKTFGYNLFPNESSMVEHCDDGFVDNLSEETFVKAPYHSQVQCTVSVVTKNITMENDATNVMEAPHHGMVRSTSDSAAPYQSLNRETMTYKETSKERFTFDNVHMIQGHNLGTIADMFTWQHKSPIEHCDIEDVVNNGKREMLASDLDRLQQPTPNIHQHKEHVTLETRVPDIFSDSDVPFHSNLHETTKKDINEGNIGAEPIRVQAVPPLPTRKADRCHQISPNRQDTPPSLPPRNTRPTPYPSSRSGGADSKFIHLNEALCRYPEWSPRENENTVESKMSRFMNSDGHYLLWYMALKKTLVLSVSHLRKLIHYAIYVTQENGHLSYFIFEGEMFPDLHALLNHYKHYGLRPQSLQGCHSNDFLRQQNLRGSRQIARLSHVQLLHPVILTRSRTSV